MKKLEFTINAGIGDNLILRIFLDTIKQNYDQIRISHDTNVINYWRSGDPQYYKFLDELGKLLFSEPPYIYDKIRRPHSDLDKIANIICGLKFTPQKPNIDHILCSGDSLNLDEKYIVITTKTRYMHKQFLYPLFPKLWKTMKEVSKKYKIVILGERCVEKSKEYIVDHNKEIIYSIYDQIISNIPNDRIVDLTVPALGITVPDIKKIQQDCLIMKEAEGVIVLGIGGNLWLALAVANTINFRSDNLGVFTTLIDMINNPKFNTAFLSKDINKFLQKLDSL
jgi:hypothetical protein